MKPMKYSNPSVRDRGGGHWQARFRYKEGDKWRTLSRNFEATSKRDANKKATQLHRQLEEEAELAKFRVLLVMDEDEAVLERFLEKYISGIEGSGGVTSTSGGTSLCLASHQLGIARERCSQGFIDDLRSRCRATATHSIFDGRSALTRQPPSYIPLD